MTAQDEEHLFGSEVHMHPHLRRVGGEFVQRCSHPGAVRTPEDSMPNPVFFVLSVPFVGEEILTIHAWYLRVVAVGRAVLEAPEYGPRRHCAGNARLLAAPTATSPRDPRQHHACSRVLTTLNLLRVCHPARGFGRRISTLSAASAFR